MRAFYFKSRTGIGKGRGARQHFKTCGKKQVVLRSLSEKEKLVVQGFNQETDLC